MSIRWAHQYIRISLGFLLSPNPFLKQCFLCFPILFLSRARTRPTAIWQSWASKISLRKMVGSICSLPETVKGFTRVRYCLTSRKPVTPFPASPPPLHPQELTVLFSLHPPPSAWSIYWRPLSYWPSLLSLPAFWASTLMAPRHHQHDFLPSLVIALHGFPAKRGQSSQTVSWTVPTSHTRLRVVAPSWGVWSEIQNLYLKNNNGVIEWLKRGNIWVLLVI